MYINWYEQCGVEMGAFLPKSSVCCYAERQERGDQGVSEYEIVEWMN